MFGANKKRDEKGNGRGKRIEFKKEDAIFLRSAIPHRTTFHIFLTKPLNYSLPVRVEIPVCWL